ncbi:hypothetical protein [Devosia sp. DBB001]|nr:hypothetical protein [Devosia sp. DBB001]
MPTLLPESDAGSTEQHRAGGPSAQHFQSGPSIHAHLVLQSATRLQKGLGEPREPTSGRARPDPRLAANGPEPCVVKQCVRPPCQEHFVAPDETDVRNVLTCTSNF